MKHIMARVSALFDASMVDVFGREQSDARVAVFSVVPREEAAAVCASLFDVCESTGKGRAVFQRLAVRLRNVSIGLRPTVFRQLQ